MEREDRLLRVLRFSDHADPCLCHCGHSWGNHGNLGKLYGGGYTGGALGRGEYIKPKLNVTDCFGAGNNVCQCMEYKYNYSDPQNRVKKAMSYWEEFPD